MASASISSICAGSCMSSADRRMNAASTGSRVSTSTDGTKVSQSASSVSRWVSLNAVAAAMGRLYCGGGAMGHSSNAVHSPLASKRMTHRSRQLFPSSW